MFQISTPLSIHFLLQKIKADIMTTRHLKVTSLCAIYLNSSFTFIHYHVNERTSPSSDLSNKAKIKSTRANSNK